MMEPLKLHDGKKKKKQIVLRLDVILMQTLLAKISNMSLRQNTDHFVFMPNIYIILLGGDFREPSWQITPASQNQGLTPYRHPYRHHDRKTRHRFTTDATQIQPKLTKSEADSILVAQTPGCF